VPSPLPLVLVGCGGHASDVLSVIEACNRGRDVYHVVGYVDDDAEADGRRLHHRNVQRVSTDAAADCGARLVLGIGYPAPRAAAVERLTAAFELAPPLVHPAASIATCVRLGLGTVVFDGAALGPLVSLGNAALVARGAIVGHDAEVGHYASLMPGCVVSGDVEVGVGALVGANATVLEGRVIGPWARLGAGAVLTKNLPPRSTAVGIPARVEPPAA
jgi:sugar O-acyltransferase (sialic acid O-acetyltransferase NeuD family)